jgi:hypothetical protein
MSVVLCSEWKRPFDVVRVFCVDAGYCLPGLLLADQLLSL